MKLSDRTWSVINHAGAFALVLGIFAWCVNQKDESKPTEPAPPKKPMTLAEKIGHLPNVCKVLIKATIANQYRGTVTEWGKKGAWRKGNYNYASHRVSFDSPNGIYRFKVLCCIERSTQRFGLWSITDLYSNQTAKAKGEAACHG